MTIEPGSRPSPSHPRLLGMPFSWGLMMLVPMGISLQLACIATALSVYADDLAWRFVTEPWVWSRLGFRLLYAGQIYLFLGFAVWVLWCLWSLIRWILRHLHRRH